MTREELITHVQKIYDHALQLMDTKNKDYTGDRDCFYNFIMTALLVDLPVEKVIQVFVANKVIRDFNVIANGNAVKGEGTWDTTVDLCNYAGILQTWENVKDGYDFNKFSKTKEAQC